jgi:hypothetical protein
VHLVSALGHAIMNDMYLVAERLIELGADVHERDSAGTVGSADALGLAAYSNNPGYIALLVENGVSVTETDSKFLLPIQWAGFYGRAVTSQELCDFGVDIN